MRLLFILLIVMGLSPTLSAQDAALTKARNLYQFASTVEDSAKGLYDLLIPRKEVAQPVLRAYRGAAFAIWADYLWNPISKLDHFNSGKALIEQAAAADPQSWEIRYVRFTVQAGSPGFLGYRGNLNEDKNMIMNALPTALRNAQDGWIAQQAALYLLQSAEVNASEKARIRQSVSAVVSDSGRGS